MPYHKGGWSEDHLSRVKNTNLPQKLKCATCKKNCLQAAFSNAQLNRLRQQVSRKGQSALYESMIRCRVCTGGTLVEIQCTICGKLKCLTEFGNSQRHEVDFARCRNCIQDILEADPLLVEPGDDDDESTIYGESRPSKSEGDDLTWPRLHNDRRVDDDFDTESHFSFTTHGNEEDDDQSVGGGVWVEPDHDDDKSLDDKDRAPVFTAYDAQGVGHQRQASPQRQDSSVGDSEQSGWQTWGGKKSRKAKQSDARPNPRQEPKKRDDRWAKIKGGRFPKGTAPSQRTPEVGRYLDPADAFDDDDDDEPFLP